MRFKTYKAKPSTSWLRQRIFRASCAGTTIVEAVVATGLIVIGFAGLFHLSVRSMSMLKLQSEMAQASQAIQERIDYLRDQSWGKLASSVNYKNYDYTLTDPVVGTSSTHSWTGLLNTLPAAAQLLTLPVETVTVSAYPAGGSPPAPFTVKNQAGIITVTPSGGSDLSDQKMVRVDTRLEWKEVRSGRARTQETSFIVSQEGVGK